jgi:hypothetical protein
MNTPRAPFTWAEIRRRVEEEFKKKRERKERVQNENFARGKYLCNN